MLARDGLLLLLVVRVGGAPADLAGAGLAALAVVHVARAGLLAGQRTVLARTVWPLAWRHLRVPGLAVPAERPVSRRARRASTLLAEVLDLPVAAGLLLVAAGATGRWLLAGLGLSAVLALAVGIPLAARVRALPARSRDDVVAAVRAAVVDLAPRVVIYFGGPPSSTHALNVWVPVLERLDVPVLVLVRQRVHLDQLDSTRLPAVWLPLPGDVEALAVPLIALAMYPTNITQNNHLIRVPGITDVFVGHGDSDKGGSFTPLSRIYDEVWVAGPAGRDRYRLADVGVRDEQVREVGRPQLAEITRAADGSPVTPGLFTVLYAPTWEGFYAEYSYSSLQVMGERLVRVCSPSTGCACWSSRTRRPARSTRRSRRRRGRSPASCGGRVGRTRWCPG